MPLNPHVKGGSDVPITDGGTDASAAASALANLGGLNETSHDLLDHTGLTGVGDLTTVAHNSLSHIGTPGVGKVVQQVFSELSGVINTAGGIPADNTTPLSGEGTLLISASITPTSLSNFLLLEVSGHVYQANQEITTVAIFRSGFSNAIVANSVDHVSVGLPNGSGGNYHVRRRIAVPALGSLTFTVRGGSTAAAATFNGLPGGGAAYSSAGVTVFSITEIAP